LFVCSCASRTARKEFINSKYVDRRFSRKTCSSATAKMVDLCEAVQSRDLLALLQVYAEGVDLMEPLPEAGPVSLLPPPPTSTPPSLLSDWVFGYKYIPYIQDR